MMPAPLGPNHALDSFGIRVQAEQASRRELPGGMGGGEVCRAMSSTAWTPQEVAPPPWESSGGPLLGGDQDVEVMVLQSSPHPTPEAVGP